MINKIATLINEGLKPESCAVEAAHELDSDIQYVQDLQVIAFEEIGSRVPIVHDVGRTSIGSKALQAVDTLRNLPEGLAGREDNAGTAEVPNVGVAIWAKARMVAIHDARMGSCQVSAQEALV